MAEKRQHRLHRADAAARKRQRGKPIHQSPVALAERADPIVLRRAIADPGRARPAGILALQRAYGNRAVTGLIQTKLMVGPVGDVYEREAERVAGQVLTMPAPASGQRPAAGGQPTAQRQAEEDEELQMKPLVQRQAEEDEELQMQPSLQRRADGGFEAGPELESRLAAQRGNGSPLPEDVRAQMEPRFGADFSGVRVHTDGEAAQLNRALNSKAFTHGQDIYFRGEEYAPETPSGQKLLAHELTHTIQQTGKVQRLPTASRVTSDVGAPKKKKGQSERYKAFLRSLDAYNGTIMPQVAQERGDIEAQVARIEAALEGVINAAAKYNKIHQKDERALYVAAIGEQARLEKIVVKTRAQYFINNPAVPRPLWSQVIPKEMGTRTIDLAKGRQTGTAKGGINVVGSYEFPSGYMGFFKEEKGKIENKTESGIAEDLGIPLKKPRLSERALAMYRIDQLLGANVITRTDRAFKRKGVVVTSKIQGVISEKAKGEQFGQLGKGGRVVKTAAQKGGKPADTISFDDPVLQRSLSKLNVIDALCYQVDRHAGNFYVETDGHGHVVSVTGIDNDLAFPAKDKYKDISKMYREYPGVSFYVDKEVAEMILALQEDDLRAVLQGLLADSEIENTIQRLRGLKERLLAAKEANRLLEPHQWNATTAAKEEAEGVGYIYDMRWRL